ncbi:TldD/PmbA family protein [bacterium]|nr:TldD/PmbA family protein [bacterium]
MNSKECFELAKWAITYAKKCGAQDAAVDVHDRREIQVQFRDQNIEKLQEANRHSLAIATYLNNRYSSQNTNNLKKDFLEKFIEEAVASTKYLSEDPYRKLPDPKYYSGREKKELDLRDPSYESVRTEDRIACARAAALASSSASDRIVSVTSGFSDNLTRMVKVHSNGFEGELEFTSFSLYSNPTLKDDEGKLVEEYAYGDTKNKADLPDPQKVGVEATKRALQRIGQKKIESGVMDMVVENRVASQVIWPLIGPMSASALQQKQSFLEGRLGQKITSERLTMIDDPFLIRGQGSRLFDGEGLAARCMPVIEKGILKTYYVDNYYGRKLGMEPTTGDTSNLVFAYGAKSCDEIISGISRGIFVTGFIGGNSNGTTGDFSFGISGMLIENGRQVKPVFEMNVSGNMLALWENLADVGNDPDIYSSWRTPAFHFRNVQFSGI